jgi:hypothetical protein
VTPSTKPVTRVTSAAVRDAGKYRLVVATITGSLIELRLKGCRQVEVVDVASLWHGAVKARVWAAKQAKKKARGK